MSGFWVGHSITVTSSSERNVLTVFTVWHRALSCINIAGWLIAVLKLGITCFFDISLYTVVLILPYSLTRGPIPAAEIMPNTIILPLPNLTLLLVHSGKYCSFGQRQMNLLLSQPNRLNFDSSLEHCQSIWRVQWQISIILFCSFWNIRLCRSYLTVQIYFIKSLGNSVPLIF